MESALIEESMAIYQVCGELRALSAHASSGRRYLELLHYAPLNAKAFELFGPEVPRTTDVSG